jgi:hypothetical protein
MKFLVGSVIYNEKKDDDIRKNIGKGLS